MTATKETRTLDEMLQADRKKKKHEDLWNSIRNKDRRASAPGAVHPNLKKGSAGASLASRLGINKRSNSVQNLQATARGGRGATLSRNNSERGNRLYSQLQARSTNDLHEVANVRSPLGHTGEISIRGRAKPPTYTVVASNFAPGTTAGDIESVMAPFGDLTGCRIISAQPTVMAEMVFSERSAAQNVIDYFNNKKADGRLLYVYLKDQNSTSFAKAHSRPDGVGIRAQNAAMDIDMEDTTKSQPRRAEPSVQDGRYGFGDNTFAANSGAKRRDGDRRHQSGLRSDEMIGRGRGYSSRRRGN